MSISRFAGSLTSILSIPGLLLLFGAGCGSSYSNDSNPVAPPTVSAGSHLKPVNMQNTRFQPADLTIAAGDTVKWVNQDNATHTTTSGAGGKPDGKWDSGNMSKGGTFTRVFATKGTYPYYCTLHNSMGMSGTITVQ